MNRTTLKRLLVLASASSSLCAFADQRHVRAEDQGGVVYAMTNSSQGNEILVFLRDRTGHLHPVPQARIATGGLGASDNAAIDPLGSQNSLVYDEQSELLFAVNAGDDTVTVFETQPLGLDLRRKAVFASGGSIPVSVAFDDGLLYVLNAGGSGTVTTFAPQARNDFRLIGSLQLGLVNGTSIPFGQILAPGQVGVDELARRLIVTHAGGRELLLADLDDSGVPVGPLASTPTPGVVPFSFDTTRYGNLLVAEAGSGAVSVFAPPSDPTPLAVTASSVSSGQAATCWIVVHEQGFVYVSNTASNTISRYAYTRTGGLELRESVAATTGGAPTDLALTGNGAYLYSLDAATGEISAFAVDEDTGELLFVERQGGLPALAGVQGIAARDF